MIDVQPPEHTVHTWRDFSIHIATICVGLLIAIGLEQSVEAFHRAHERAELRGELHRESVHILHEQAAMTRYDESYVVWLDERIQQIRSALDRQQPLSAPTPPPNPLFNIPSDQTWKSSEISGLAPLLTQDEVNAYMEIDSLIHERDGSQNAAEQADSLRRQFEATVGRIGPDGQPDLAHLSPDDLRKELSLLISEREAGTPVLIYCRSLQGAETAIVAGHLDFSVIEASEQKEAARRQ